MSLPEALEAGADLTEGGEHRCGGTAEDVTDEAGRSSRACDRGNQVDTFRSPGMHGAIVRAVKPGP